VKQVLLINNDNQVRNRTAAMLHEAGWEVWMADKDEVVFESLVARRPMMVIVDIEMQGGAGFEAISTARRLYSSLFIVAVTRGKNEELWKRVSVACGASDYVVGPVSPTKLQAAIQSGIDAGQINV
jgi:DNA-binding response OmpR family regulator